MSNFILCKNGMQIFDKFSQGIAFLKYLAQCRFSKKVPSCDEAMLKIVAINDNDYAGYSRRSAFVINDLLFTRTFLKQMYEFLSPALVRLLVAISIDDFSAGKRLREQGNMKSVLMPNTNQRKVLTFCPVYLEEWSQRAYILASIGEADNWNSHKKSLSHKNDFRQKAYYYQYYYESVYREALAYTT
jgi:hypothetical protein